jgi:acylphosphatase|tara:strand:+ start:2095 stop:2379 length:285 start_codon:yes stop_codon:yes gene_type:complete
MSDLASVRAIVHGYVQGVLFRDFTLRRAKELGLGGYVRNLPNWTAVEVQAEGEREKLEKLVEQLKPGPSRAKVEKVEVDWSKYTGNYPRFSIRY